MYWTNSILAGGIFLALLMVQREGDSNRKQHLADLIQPELVKVRECFERVKAINQNRPKVRSDDEPNPFAGGCNLTYHSIETQFLIRGAKGISFDTCFGDTHTLMLWTNYHRMGLEEFNGWLTEVTQKCEDQIIDQIGKL